MGYPFPGGIAGVRIADTEAFDTSDTENPSVFVIEIDEDEIAKEGTEFPDPEEVVAGQTVNDKDVPGGYDQPVSLRIKELPTIDGQSLKEARNATVEVFIEVTSKAKAPDGTPKYVVVYKEVRITTAIHAVVNAARDTYGGFVLSGKTTGFTEEDLFSVVQGGGA